MRLRILLSTAFIALIACKVTKQATISKNELPQIIDSLYRADQSTANIQPPDSAAAAFQRVTRSNFPLVSGIFEKFGYPGYELVGKETSDKYFLLVQHSDFNVKFQQDVLQQMKQHVDRQDAPGKSFAYLTDRVEINSGRPQVYGTQVFMSANTVSKPCIDTVNLDKRRQSVGLGPIRDYLEACNDTFFQLNPNEKRP